MDPEFNIPEAAIENTNSRLEAFLLELPQQYDLLDRVSKGGMGSIYKARNRYTGAYVAIKIMRPESTFDQEAMQRFIIEAKAAHSLKHPNICQVHDFGVSKSGMPYLVMDWIEGISLQKKIVNHKGLSPAEAIPIFQQITAGLAHAHEKKVIHRDVKPENIMLSTDSHGRLEVRIVDFGVAKVINDEEGLLKSHGLTQTGFVVGTPLYMSPEQAGGEPVDKRADIYSLGCVMYYTLIGQPPFMATSAVLIMNKHIHEDPKIGSGLKIPTDLRMMMLRAMEKNPKNRYQNMEQLAADLKKLTKGIGVRRHILSSEKQSAKRRLIIGLCFVLSFIAMYFISLALQNFFDAENSETHNKRDVVKNHKHLTK